MTENDIRRLKSQKANLLNQRPQSGRDTSGIFDAQFSHQQIHNNFAS